jgi:hypothetical protein
LVFLKRMQDADDLGFVEPHAPARATGGARGVVEVAGG